mmetsp:Transcript_88784/g.250079  ORF Transcript_88784/g.250079 Transcript_88784/m.250079 type:complete len:191 (-) Transcript_88784:67-639(-)
MELARRGFLTALCVFSALEVSQAAHAGMKLKATASSALRRSAASRVDAIAGSLFAVESALALPRNVSKEKQSEIVATLEGQIKKLEASVAGLGDGDVKGTMSEEQKRSQQLKASMKPEDRAMMEKMDAWSSRMSRKTRLGAFDVISKLKNALHLVKKGALSGNADAEAGLNKVLSKMGQMMGGSTGKFLH